MSPELPDLRKVLEVEAELWRVLRLLCADDSLPPVAKAESRLPSSSRLHGGN